MLLNASFVTFKTLNSANSSAFSALGSISVLNGSLYHEKCNMPSVKYDRNSAETISKCSMMQILMLSGKSIPFIFRRLSNKRNFCTNQQPPQRGGAVPDPVWFGSKYLLAFLRVPVTSDTPFVQIIFSPSYPLNNRRRAAHSFFKIGHLSSPFSCLFPSRLRLFILFLLLMSGDVHPNPGPIFPCSVCAGNVTWRGRSVQCCTCSKWVHLKCSLLSFSKIIGISHSWS